MNILELDIVRWIQCEMTPLNLFTTSPARETNNLNKTLGLNQINENTDAEDHNHVVILKLCSLMHYLDYLD